ncbi:hypothetical protein F4677DRAFT_413835 [Hypoxylon crocopeplum]|nr:hypothetical protein F4677DRAFT_413835 [Hypoxylon crocopeplum]
MSGLEVAGIVLGAFPIAVEALEKYREVFRRLGLFHRIRVEYLKCKHNLKFHQASFAGHIRRLLLPLIEDDNKINELMSDPAGRSWKDKEIAWMLQHQLGRESHELFIQCIGCIKNVMEKLNHELALDSTSLQDSLNKPRMPMSGSRLKESATKANVQFQLYRLKFSNGESVRTELFKELERYDSQFARLLDMGDKETELAQKRKLTKSSLSESVLCSFWIYANSFFKALAATWTCCCEEQHLTSLLLQHRTSKINEFNVLFAKGRPSCWRIQKTLITEGDGDLAAAITADVGVGEGTTVRRAQHSVNIPIRPASEIKDQHIQKAKPQPDVICKSKSSGACQSHINQISCLCSSLEQGIDGFCGYLTGSDYRYYVYRVSQQQSDSFNSITIDQILRREVSPAPSRRQRYALSFILASSFLQLLDTPWLPESWRKSDIVFISDENKPNMFLLDQPHLSRKFIATPPPEDQQTSLAITIATEGSRTRTFRSLELLGIVLLELCFGQPLEAQPCRKQWPTGDGEMQRYAFDFVAAREWVGEVNEEAGPDFDEAIRWCFEGHRNTPPEKWRQEMLRQVVQPLERCHRYLSEGRRTEM